MDERDRSAVAVTDQDRVANGQRVEQFRKDFERFAVHVVHAARTGKAVGLAVPVARINQRRHTRGLDNPGGKILPKRDRAQAFMQEHQHRCVRRRAGARRGVDPAVLETMAASRYEHLDSQVPLQGFRGSAQLFA